MIFQVLARFGTVVRALVTDCELTALKSSPVLDFRLDFYCVRLTGN